jgi:choline dehydrogenase-like flavoprotein
LKAHLHLADYVTFFCDFEVQRLLFSEDAQKVIGVEGPRKQAVFCRQEVILCAGAIESPALLLVSGIGLDDALGQVGICPRASCAGVGRRLRDHVLVPRVLLSRWSPPTLSPNGVHALCYASNGDNRFQFFMNDAAVYSQLVPHFVASFVRRRIYKPAIMASTVNFILSGLFLGLRTVLRLLMTYTPAYFILRYHIITMNIALMNPKSTGSVTIRRREPSKKIEPLRRKDVDIHIDAGYLSNPDDVLALWEGWKTSTHLFDSFLCQCLEIFPGVIFQGIKLMRNRETTDASWFLRFASHFCLPYFHWCGTCAMKTDDNAEWVVDSSLRVRGVRGIRVCDASVFPSAISGPTALTCAGVGHLCASILLRENDKKNG